MIKKINYYFITLFIFGNSIFKYRGTWASLLTTLFMFVLIHIINVPILILLFLLSIIFVYSFIAIKSCLDSFKNDDPQEVVIDEFIGQSIPILLYELFHSSRSNTLADDLQVYFWFFL